MSSPDELTRLFDVLRAAGTISVLCHENPDADTLAAGVALASAFGGLGKQTEVLCGDAVPAALAPLPGAGSIRQTPSLAPDAVILVDAAQKTRVGTRLLAWLDGLDGVPVINIDHHVSNTAYGDLNYVDHEAAATSEAVAELIPRLGASLGPTAAAALLAGIIHDTNGFRLPGTTAKTLRIAAELVEAGADLADANRWLFGARPFLALALWGQVIGRIQSCCGGRIVHASVSREMLASGGATLADAEDLPELLASVDADVTLLFRELDDDLTRVSIRTSGSVEAVAIARPFGGGGHLHAAGCTLSAPLEAARAAVLARSHTALGRQPD